MNTISKLAATLVLATACLAAHAQEGDKMLKKEGKTDGKMIRENHRMMKDGKVKHDESMGSKPKVIKEEDRLDHKKEHKQKFKK
jgi:hypothetical protein